MYEEGWDSLREERLKRLKSLGIVPKGARTFPRLANVEAWDDMSAEERRERARDMEVYAAMIDYMDEQITRVLDHLKETGEYDMSRAAGRTVEAASVTADSGDLIVEFPERLCLQLLQLSSGYESWRLSADDGESICMGGGSIARFPRR